jgi:hypothetical protein
MHDKHPSPLFGMHDKHPSPLFGMHDKHPSPLFSGNNLMVESKGSVGLEGLCSGSNFAIWCLPTARAPYNFFHWCIVAHVASLLHPPKILPRHPPTNPLTNKPAKQFTHPPPYLPTHPAGQPGVVIYHSLLPCSCCQKPLQFSHIFFPSPLPSLHITTHPATQPTTHLS